MTVDIVNGDFMGSSNITVQDSGYVSIQSWADSIWLTSTQRSDNNQHELGACLAQAPRRVDVAGVDERGWY